MPVPSTTISDAKLKAREERKLRKEARKHEKKLRNQRRKEKRREKSKRSEKRSHERSFQPEDQDLKYLPNDEDFPEIRKFNEVSPSKQKGENLYAAALAAVRGADSEPPRHRKRGESESESESDDEDEESEHESDEDSSHESSMSESESNEVSATHKNESPRQPPIGNQKAAADHDDDDDDADDIIVFQPAFPQLNYSSIDHNLPNSYNSPTPRQHAFTSNNIPQEVSMSTEIVDDDPIDKDSLAYLQALHKKNTEHGWLSNHPTHQDQSTTSKYPFMHDEAHRFDLWNPHHNLEGNLFNYGTNTATESIFAATAAVVDSQHNQPHQWGNGGGDVYAEKVPPPPGFVDLPKSIPSQMEDYQMNPNAFLPTSLRQYPPPGNSQSPPSIFSMLYGSGYDHQDHYTGNWNPPPPPPPGYQMQQHYGT